VTDVETATSRPSTGWWRRFRGWPRAGRWAAYVAVGLVLLLVVLTVTAVVLVRRPLPQVSGEITLPGLSAPVEVLRDEHGIPQIYADTTADLMRAEGFVHAQDRFWEMDVRRHITAGRLSELFGEDGLETDKYVRTMGWRRVAEQELALLEPETRSALEWYADGVNAYLDTREPSQLSVAYTLLRADGLDYHPEPWTAVDSLAWLKAMAWDLRGNMDEEIQRVLVQVNHGRSALAEVYPPYPYAEHTPIVDHGAVVDGVFEPRATKAQTRNPLRPAYTADQVDALAAVGDGIERLPQLLGHSAGIGSNSWVVDGDHSTTGKPILANDPHLGVSQPGIWYQIGLHCRTLSEACPYDVSGFSFSGVPGVVIGHNQRIAWGFTNLGPDVTDLFLEKIKGTRWLYAGKYRPLTIRHETISVLGGDDFDLTIRETAHGPLLSDVSRELSTVGANAEVEKGPDRGNGYAVALEWTALHPAPTADAMLGLDAARDWTSFRAAARSFDVPAQNMVYADVDGHIGYQAPGRIPIRKSGNDGLEPSPGWIPANDWTGKYVPFDALPSELDPDAGFFATANQAAVGAGYPYYLTSDWDYGYRAQRIRDLLTSATDGGGQLSVDDMTGMQLDTFNGLAPTLVPYLLDIALPPGYPSDGQRLLADWDFQEGADSPAAAYFNVVWSNVLRLTFQDELRKSLWPDGSNRWWAAVSGLLEKPNDAWWDDRKTDDVVETRDDVLRQALLDARDELTRREALDPADWTWGRLHRMNLHDQTLGESGIGLVERLFNRNGYQVAGGGSIVDATEWNAAEGYLVDAAPSMRMVVSLANLDDSRWINLTGASGHPGSSHYADQTGLYVDGRTLPWVFSRGPVDDATQDTLRLVP
jgi:penicillin amidase